MGLLMGFGGAKGFGPAATINWEEAPGRKPIVGQTSNTRVQCLGQESRFRARTHQEQTTPVLGSASPVLPLKPEAECQNSEHKPPPQVRKSTIINWGFRRLFSFMGGYIGIVRNNGEDKGTHQTCWPRVLSFEGLRVPGA